jgi:uncharacterized Tic20 family protein
VTCPSCGIAAPAGAKFCAACGAALPPTQPPPQPSTASAISSIDERTWLVACHLSALLGFFMPFGNIVGPLVVWLLRKNESPAIDREGKDSLNFQISMTVYIVASYLLFFAGFFGFVVHAVLPFAGFFSGFLLAIGFGVFDLIQVIIAAIKTSNVETYRYPITIRFVV